MDPAIETLLSTVTRGPALHLHCGEGRLSVALADRAGLVFAVERNLTVTRVRDPRISYVCGGARLPVRDGAARTVLCEGVPDPAELRRVSAPGAVWLLVVPNAARRPGGAALDVVRGWVMDRPHRIYARSVLAQRRNLDDIHAELLLRIDDTFLVRA